MQEVRAAIHKIKNEKSTRPKEGAAEMLKASRESGVRCMTDVLNTVATTTTTTTCSTSVSSALKRVKRSPHDVTPPLLSVHRHPWS